MTKQRKLRHLLVLSTLVAALILSAPMLAFAKTQVGLDPGTQFYVPKPSQEASEQIADLIASHNTADAILIRRMIKNPQAAWFTKGTPESVERDVRKTVERAIDQKSVPILVAYNIPFRDCAQYSAGGATTAEEYKAWIDGFAAGIGNAEVVVLLEPDGLGIIPWYKQFGGTPAQAGVYEWCRPVEANEFTAADERFEMLNYAVDALKAMPNVSVYLDGTHSSWLGSGDAAHRLIQAGVERADGFFLNVSNYRLTEHLEKYGQWISDCIYLSQNSWWEVEWCASQYHPANPNDFSTWGLSDAAYDKAFADTGLTRNPEVQAHFVIDTSRNGQGPWTPTTSYPDSQDWCNPPDRGLGLRPTANTGNPFVDAYLWVKIPGESDGGCTRGTAGPEDPVWHMIDPGAGQWFREMALELVHNANPPLP
ncbi:MAG TPA: glycoside hydrolase family 6 protein [Anaerolineales bacterium]|nr:glycoside hydrolase family 6 protein [Anaerolineales bacterium]